MLCFGNASSSYRLVNLKVPKIYKDAPPIMKQALVLFQRKCKIR